MSDYGCMLRAYHRDIIDNINRCQKRPPSFRPWRNPLPPTRPRWRWRMPSGPKGRANTPLQACPSQLRPDDRFFRGAAAALRAYGILTALFAVAFALFLLIRRFIVGRKWKVSSPSSPSSSFSSASPSSASASSANMWGASTRKYGEGPGMWCAGRTASRNSFVTGNPGQTR